MIFHSYVSLPEGNPIPPPVFLNMSQAVLSARLLARARYKAERQTEAETAGAGDVQRVG